MNPAIFLPEIVVLAGALFILLLDVLDLGKVEIVGAVAVVTSGFALLMVLADLGYAPLFFLQTIPSSLVDAAPSGPPYPLFNVTSLGLVFQGVFLLAAFLVALASLSHPSEERGAAVFFGLLLVATLGMMLVAIASDLIFLLLAVEVDRRSRPTS